LIKTFEEFENWLRTAAINPATKTSFWNKLFNSTPTRKAFNKRKANDLAESLNIQIIDLKNLLYSSDDSEINKKVSYLDERSNKGDAGFQIKSDPFVLSGNISDSEKKSRNSELNESFRKSKLQFLNQHILEYQKIFREIHNLSDGDSFLFLDDLYHIRRSDQASVIDYFHRIAKGNNLWLKIGTIRFRTRWYINGDPPIGLKIGDDADQIDLDLTLEKYALTKNFLVKILKYFLDECNLELEQVLTSNAITRLILASGGVARDFLGIFRKSISVAQERLITSSENARLISVEDVNNASGEYDSSKREELARDTIDEKSEIENEFTKVIEFCRTRKYNVFLVEKDTESNQNILELVDLRLIHKVSSRVTVSDRPGKIFEAYMLDLSQYTATRKVRDLKIVEFWRSNSREELRRVSLIYSPNVTRNSEQGIIYESQSASDSQIIGLGKNSKSSMSNGNEQLNLFK
jgi:hypothetical protein